MTMEGDRFQFDPPDGWRRSREGSRFVFEGSAGEVLIVSGSGFTGAATPAEERGLDRRLFQNGLEVIKAGASDSDLTITRALSREPDTELECWVVETETKDGAESFLEAVFYLPLAALLVTLEGPRNDVTRSTFNTFLRSVRAVEPPKTKA